jgi:hypothetical protein
VVHEEGDVPERVRTADGGRGLQGEGRGEDAQSREHQLCGGGQQPVAPRHRVPQGALAGRRVEPAAHELQARVEVSGELARAESPQLARGELDGQRQAVEGAADADDPVGDRLLVRRPGEQRAVGEQPAGVRFRERLHGEDVLAVDAE